MKNKLKKITSLIIAACISLTIGVGCTGDDSSSKDSSSSMDGNKKAELLDYESYKKTNKLMTSVWDFPELTYDSDAAEGSRLDCDKNDKIAKDMVNAGVDIVNITGLGTNAAYTSWQITNFSREKTITILKEIINFFNKYGIKTVLNSHNHGNNNSTGLINDFTDEFSFKDGFPDFSACDGFYGMIVWDEPSVLQYKKISQFAESFDSKYNGSNAMIMANLLPAYGQAGWGVDTYDEYIDNYGETVLSKVNNTQRYISVDTYPVRADGGFGTTFLTDIARFKVAGLKFDAMTHICLQSTATAWDADTQSFNLRTPNREELGIQIYSALALGADSISWYTYVDPQENEPLGMKTAPVDFKTGERNEENYNNFKSINDEIGTFDYALKCFTWKGFLVNATSALLYPLANTQYTKNYYISDASKTKTLTSISAGKTPYIMGQMVDSNGNEGFMIANYTIPNTAKDGDTYKMTLNFKDGINRMIIWQNGEKSIVSVTGGSYELELKVGGGAFVIPYAE